jgi:hypothetical protein
MIKVDLNMSFDLGDLGELRHAHALLTEFLSTLAQSAIRVTSARWSSRETLADERVKKATADDGEESDHE